MLKEKIITLNFLKRVLLFIVGLFIMAFGVAFSIKADIGISPISCVPYIYSLQYPLSIGEITIIFNIIFLFLQILILGKEYKIVQLVQLPAVIVFGYCIDIAMFIVQNIHPINYLEQFLLCVIACVVLAFGIFILIKTRLSYLPLEGLIIAIIQKFKMEFGKVKISMDSLMIVLGGISSFIFFENIVGIREGSIIAALSIGALIKFFTMKFTILDNWLFDETVTHTTNEDPKQIYNDTFVITISREFGSGGHEIGKLIAKHFGISFYDKEIIDLTAQKTGYTKEYIKANEQKLTNSLLYDLYEQNYMYVNDEIPPKDALFLVQSKIIRDICSKESCVIVGRCANFILKDHPNCKNIFIHANKEYRKEKINNEYKIKPAFTDEDLEISDEKRANYCFHFTKKQWRDVSNYHLTIDSSSFSTVECTNKVIEAIQ